MNEGGKSTPFHPDILLDASHRRCFKELYTEGNRMKKLILTLSLLGCVSWAQAEPIEIKGTVDGIFAGEMDSFKLGDILIFFVRNGADNKRYGLVDFDDEFYYYNGDFEKEFLNKWV